MHAYTLYGNYRPLGTTGILASWNAYDGYKLHMIECGGLVHVKYINKIKI